MKNATCYCAGPAYYRMCSTDVYCSKQTAAAPAKPSPIISSFLNWAEENCRMQPKFVAAQKMLLKQNQQHRKWIARFYYFAHLYRWKRVCIAHNNCMSCLSIWATLSALLIALYFGSFQLFLHSDQPLWGWNNPVQRFVGGRLHYPRRGGGGFTHWLTDCFDATDDDQRQHHHAEHHFQLQHQLTLRILHRAQQHHADVFGGQ